MTVDEPAGAAGFSAVWRLTGGRRSLWISGELDLATAPLLEAALDGEIHPGTDITFDVGELTFMDATGLRVLVGVRERVGADGRVVLRRCGRPVRRLLAITHLDGDGWFDQPVNGAPA